MSRSRRNSVRLPDDRLERLQRLCQETGYDVSQLVRQALDALPASEPALAPNGVPPRRVSPPEEVFDLVPKYLGWGRGDLREERNRQFKQPLAVCFACKKLYPRTRGIIEGYEALLQICEFFGLGEGV